MNVLVPNVLTPTLYLGFLYLCALPATVQSAIAYTSVAGGNVAAAICSASASSILGVFLSPILVGMLMQTQGGDTDTLHAIGSIIMQLMVPFVVGHLSRPLIAKWVERHKNWSISLTGHLFCWWFMWRSAKRSFKGFGVKSTAGHFWPYQFVQWYY